MKTREQVEQRALELFPIHEEFDSDRLKELREAYLQGWEEAQQDKQTCGFCIEPATELTNEKHSESLDTKENEGSELPSEKQKELLCEMMRKDEASGMYDDLSDVINNVNTDSAINMGRTLSIADDNPIVYSDADASKTIKEAFENIPKEVKDRHAKAAYNEHKQLREAAERVVWLSNYVKAEIHETRLEKAIEELEKALR